MGKKQRKKDKKRKKRQHIDCRDKLIGKSTLPVSPSAPRQPSAQGSSAAAKASGAKKGRGRKRLDWVWNQFADGRCIHCQAQITNNVTCRKKHLLHKCSSTSGHRAAPACRWGRWA